MKGNEAHINNNKEGGTAASSASYLLFDRSQEVVGGGAAAAAEAVTARALSDRHGPSSPLCVPLLHLWAGC